MKTWLGKKCTFRPQVSDDVQTKKWSVNNYLFSVFTKLLYRVTRFLSIVKSMDFDRTLKR